MPKVLGFSSWTSTWLELKTLKKHNHPSHLCSHLPLGVGLLHDGEESVDLSGRRRSEVLDLDVVQLQLRTGVVVRGFRLTQTHQVFDVVLQHVAVLTWHPGQRQAGHFILIHPGEVVRSRHHDCQTEKRREDNLHQNVINKYDLHLIKPRKYAERSWHKKRILTVL